MLKKNFQFLKKIDLNFLNVVDYIAPKNTPKSQFKT